MSDNELQIVGSGKYVARCPTCERDDDCPNIEYRSDEKYNVKMESRDRREIHSDHRPIARGPNGERIYG